MSGAARAEVGRERREPVSLDLAKLGALKPAELALRFGFGAGIALVAGFVGIRFGYRIGGLFLAFPAVLPASLTLLEKKDGTAKADVDALGAILGSCAMLAFAAAIAIGLPLLGALVAVGAAAVLWSVVALALFFALRAVLNR
jgi:hypothetical protein